MRLHRFAGEARYASVSGSVHLRGPRSVAAVQIMQNACEKIRNESAMRRESDHRTYICLAWSLPGAENGYAAHVIYSACARR